MDSLIFKSKVLPHYALNLLGEEEFVSGDLDRISDDILWLQQITDYLWLMKYKTRSKYDIDSINPDNEWISNGMLGSTNTRSMLTMILLAKPVISAKLVVYHITL